MMTDITFPAWLELNKPPVPTSRELKWVYDLRKQHWDEFKKCGLPTRNNERWKYTDFSFIKNKKFSAASEIKTDLLHYQIDQHRLKQGNSILFVFINGRFIPQFSDINKLTHGIIACSIHDAFLNHSSLIKNYWPHHINAQQHPFASLNAAVFSDGLFFYIPRDIQLSMPIHLLSIATSEQAFVAHAHHLVVLNENTELTLVEEFMALNPSTDYLMNNVLRMVVGQQSRLEYVKIQNESNKAIHFAHLNIKQMQSSKTKFVNFSAGGLFARDDLSIKLLEPGAECKANGFYHLNHDEQFIDHHVDIDHLAPNSQSEMIYKGVLEKKSRLVFNGKLHVDKKAQKIVAHQANHNLLLSQQAEVYSKPELEIYADDVKCKHGATTGQLDETALFYLRSRGITEKEAIIILLQAFADEILQQVNYPSIKQHVKKMV